MPNPFKDEFPQHKADSHGIDVRTYIATAIMSGFAAGASVNETSEKVLADSAVRWADALIERLNK